MEKAYKLETYEPRCCAEMLDEFQSTEFPYKGEILEFTGVGDRDVYNISHPFKIGNKTVIAGRV